MLVFHPASCETGTKQDSDDRRASSVPGKGKEGSRSGAGHHASASKRDVEGILRQSFEPPLLVRDVRHLGCKCACLTEVIHCRNMFKLFLVALRMR